MEQLALLQPTQSSIKRQQVLYQQDTHPTNAVCKIAKAEDVDLLFELLRTNDEFLFIQKWLDTRKQDSYIHVAEFYRDEEQELKCKISAYQTNHVFLMKRHELVNSPADWFFKSKLWFKVTSKNNTLGDLPPSYTYEALKSFIEEYREELHVDLTKPVFSININSFRKKSKYVRF